MATKTLLEISRDKSIDSTVYQSFVLRHLCVNSFGDEIFTDTVLVKCLKDFVIEMDDSLNFRQQEELSIKVGLRRKNRILLACA